MSRKIDWLNVAVLIVAGLILLQVLTGCATAPFDPPVPKSPITLSLFEMRVVHRDDLDRFVCRDGMVVVEPIGGGRLARDYEVRCVLF